MKLKYASVVPYTKRYENGRLPVSERAGQLPGHGTMRHSTSVDITPRHLVEQSEAAKQERVNKMFQNMKAVEGALPVVSRGRGGVDLTQTEEYKALAGMPVGDPNVRTGFFAVEYASEALAKKAQANVNRYARAGAGTFKTSLPKGTSTLYVKRISDVYTPQRGDSAGE